MAPRLILLKWDESYFYNIGKIPTFKLKFKILCLFLLTILGFLNETDQLYLLMLLILSATKGIHAAY